MKLLRLGALLLSCSTGALATPANNCRAVTLSVSGTAQNLNLTGVPLGSLNDILSFVQNATKITVSGPQTLAGTYCTPTVKNFNNDKLQVLFGSITADRSGWQAQGGVGLDFPPYQPERYSWVAYANALGYATLALDRLGNGKSSHPDPILVVQAPYETELYHDLAQKLRSNKSLLGRTYSYLIYVGNSYGSQLGAGLAGKYPTDYNDFVLTGFSNAVRMGFVGVSLVLPAPAAVVDPARFGTLPPGYVTTSSEVGRTNSFFGSKAQVAFDDQNAHLFFQRKDVVSIGQFVSVYGLDFRAPAYTGRVLVLTGEQDQPFCGPGSPVIGPAGCGPILANTKELFPAARYNYKSVNATGHAIQLHYSSQKVFAIAHTYLAGVSYQGGPPA